MRRGTDHFEAEEREITVVSTRAFDDCECWVPWAKFSGVTEYLYSSRSSHEI
jgi:hypothetical protein